MKGKVSMRKENSQFVTGFVSEAGSHIDNRDYFAYMETDDMACYVLAHGLDTDQEIRSAEMAAKAVLENFMEKPFMSKRRLKEGLRDAQEWLQFESRRVRLKASLLAVVTDYTRMVYASCGNVRLYHFRGGRLNFRSRDHSLAQAMADEGRIPEEAATLHEERGNLLEYLGKPGKSRSFLSKKTLLADGDVLLLATPGMWGNVELAEMLGALEEAKDPNALTDTLEEVLLSRQLRTVPNYTAAAVFIDKIFQEKVKNRRKLIKRIVIGALALMLAGGGAWLYAAKAAQRKAEAIEDMIQYGSQGDDYAHMGDFEKSLKAYSEAKNAATKANDKISKKLYVNKQNISQAMVDGNGYVDKGDFDNAQVSYEKALKEAKVYLPSDSDGIQQKLESLDDYAAIRKQMDTADLKFQGQDYIGALALYNKANTAATEAGYDAAIESIAKKKQETEDKIAALKREIQEIRAGQLEARGKRLLAAEDFDGAIDAYNDAEEIYQAIGKLESVVAVERTISKIEDKKIAKQQEEAAALAKEQEAADQAAAEAAAAEQAAAEQAAAQQAAEVNETPSKTSGQAASGQPAPDAAKDAADTGDAAGGA